MDLAFWKSFRTGQPKLWICGKKPQADQSMVSSNITTSF